MKTVMGIDLGTQSTKVLIYDYEKKSILAVGSAPHELISREDGTREQKAEWWITALRESLAGIDPALKKSVEAIGVSGQQHGFVPIDDNGKVLYNVKLWCDTATSAECAEITERAGGAAAVIRTAGNQVLPGYTAPKIAWLKRHHPDQYAKMRWVLLPHDYLNYYLTGNLKMEFGDASGTALLDVRNRRWSRELVKAVDPGRDLGACLPPLINAHEAAGTLRTEAAAALGLTPGIAVSSGGGDNMMGAIGTGTISDGVLTLSLGTSGTLYGYSDKPIIDPEGNLAAFCSSTGGWLPLLCTMNCTVSSELVRDLFKVDIKTLENTVMTAPIGSEGIITLPFFNGERIPNFPHGRGCIMGMTMTNVKPANIMRSSMEAAIFGMKIGYDSFKKLGYSAREIRLIGGGANSPNWRQMAADVLDLPVVVPEINEAAAFGGALQALWCLRSKGGKPAGLRAIIDEHVAVRKGQTHAPDKKAGEQYGSVYKQYRKYIDQLGPMFS